MNFTSGLCRMSAACLALVACRNVAPDSSPKRSGPARVSVEIPGAREDGSVLLPNQWSLRPAGREVALGDFPVNIAMHPDGQFAAGLHRGYGPPEVVVVRVSTGKIVSRTPIEIAFYGLALARDGKSLYVSGAAGELVYRFG